MTGYAKEACQQAQALVNGKEINAEFTYAEEKQAVVISLPQVAVLDEVQIVLPGHLISGEKQVARRCFEFLNQAEIGFVLKDEIYQILMSGKNLAVISTELSSMNLDHDLYGALMEILTA